jgi:hypothetical protein
MRHSSLRLILSGNECGQEAFLMVLGQSALEDTSKEMTLLLNLRITLY